MEDFGESVPHLSRPLIKVSIAQIPIPEVPSPEMKKKQFEPFTKKFFGIPYHYPPMLKLCESELTNARKCLKKVFLGDSEVSFKSTKVEEGPPPRQRNSRRFSDGSVNVEFKQNFYKELDKRLKDMNFADSHTPSPESIHNNNNTNNDLEVYADVVDVQKWKPHEPWYFHTVDKSKEERLLRKISQDGAFLVRDSRSYKPDQPFTLTVFYHNRLFSVKIRQLPSGQFVLGEEKHDQVFGSLFKIGIIVRENKKTRPT
ncbi:Hypothetical predicted protein [Octopus vulgaris]|uniref:SH2 domain-containing protein n=1 Tax=Octopus vulgaris TaxID=6645 RepID=A0AA36FG49_OCTVU|nr:Hypothetical predicted protein [Octopus vulgaris]